MRKICFLFFVAIQTGLALASSIAGDKKFTELGSDWFRSDSFLISKKSNQMKLFRLLQSCPVLHEVKINKDKNNLELFFEDSSGDHYTVSNHSRWDQLLWPNKSIDKSHRNEESDNLTLLSKRGFGKIQDSIYSLTIGGRQIVAVLDSTEKCDFFLSAPDEVAPFVEFSTTLPTIRETKDGSKEFLSFSTPQISFIIDQDPFFEKKWIKLHVDLSEISFKDPLDAFSLTLSDETLAKFPSDKLQLGQHNDDDVIPNLQELVGIKTQALESQMKEKGFIQSKDSLKEVLLRNNMLVQGHRFTHQNLAEPLFRIMNAYFQGWLSENDYFKLDGVPYYLNVSHWRGWLGSPFFQTSPGSPRVFFPGVPEHANVKFDLTRFKKEDFDIKEKKWTEMSFLSFSALDPFMIHWFGFYDSSKYRSSPLALDIMKMFLFTESDLEKHNKTVADSNLEHDFHEKTVSDYHSFPVEH